ncbi:hypothetical protein H5410_012135 [Solanum commersonii]|uniref:DUF1985 domain-containing protein n=1 Tax=Solanum commersonii TaxID=4109 RepID=A0A9J6AQM7_SOLCO|nr:hypothetical protein H5410_012135 [Solanum commersonii]
MQQNSKKTRELNINNSTKQESVVQQYKMIINSQNKNQQHKIRINRQHCNSTLQLDHNSEESWHSNFQFPQSQFVVNDDLRIKTSENRGQKIAAKKRWLFFTFQNRGQESSHRILLEEEGGARKSPRRSPRILSDVGTSNQKAYRRSRMRGQVSSPTDEVNDCPNFNLGISQVSGEQNKGEQNKEEQNKRQNKAFTSKKIVDCDDNFEDLAPQFQSKKLKNKYGPEKKKPVKNAKTQNQLPKNVILPESRYSICDSGHLTLIIVSSTKSNYLYLINNLSCSGIHVLVTFLTFQKRAHNYKEFGIVTGLNCVSDDTPINVPDSKCSLLSSYFPEKITVAKSHLRVLFLSKKFLDDDSAVSLVVLFFINDFLFSYEDNEYQISNRDFYLVESGQFNSYPWGLDVYKKLSDSVRHELKSTHKYYRLGGLPLALQIWIFECCSKVDEDIAIRVADSFPRILNWKTIAESPLQKYIEKCLFMPKKIKYLYKVNTFYGIFENIVASEDKVSKFRLPEPRDYHAEILKLEPKGSSHGLDMLTNEVIELRKELVKSGGTSSVIREVREPSKKQAGETFSNGLDFNREEDVAGITIEKVLSEVVVDINVQEVTDVNTVVAQPYALVDQNKKKVTPKKRGRKKDPGKLITFPYTQHFESGGILCVTRDNELDLIDSFVKWLYTGTKKRGKKPYTNALNVISPAFELGICNHIDVIFYYLRKKGKYEVNSNVRFTTTHCVFKTKITTSFFQLCDAHENKKNYKVKDSDDIARYIYGRRLSLDSCRIDIGQRSLEVYDSFPARDGMNFEVKIIVEMLSIVLPHYLSVVKFYDKCPKLKATPKYSGIDEFEKIEDCGIFVPAFAEFVSNGQHILNQQVKADILRKRFGAILWEYARRKQASDLQSEDKRPER